MVNVLMTFFFIPKKLIQPASEGEKDQNVQNQPFGDVDDHFAKGNLRSCIISV